MHDEVYLDYNATTPADRRVVEAMLPFFTDEFGNPASGPHGMGRRAEVAVENARAAVAELIGSTPGELVFTSGSTEASNLLLKGLTATATKRRRVAISATEHKAVLETAEWLASGGVPVEVVPVDQHGVLDLAAFEEVLARGDVLLASVLAANNETGTLNPLSAIAELAHRYGAVFHTDATQLAGKLYLDVRAAGVDAASVTAHKLYGPKGVGALYVRQTLRKRLVPLVHGGGHERGLRSGTLNVPGIVGFGCAARLSLDLMHTEPARVRRLRDQLHKSLEEHIGEVDLNGHQVARLPNTVNLRFAGADAEAVMANMPSVAVSTGSACTSAVPSPSHVLTAMGLDGMAASESIRFSLGRPTTTADVTHAVEVATAAVAQVRRLTGVEAMS